MSEETIEKPVKKKRATKKKIETHNETVQEPQGTRRSALLDDNAVSKEEPKAIETAPIIKSGQQALYDQLNDPEIARGLLASARNLEERFRSNGFTLLHIIKKTNVKNAVDARQMMNMLILKGYAKMTVIGREEKYKITIPVRLRIENLQKQIAEIEEQKLLIEAEIERLKELQLKKAA